MIATYTYNGTVYEAACVVSEGLKVESYTVTLTLLEGYTWADGTDGTKTFTFINYLNVASKKSTEIALEENYGTSETVLEAIDALGTEAADFTVTINGVTYTYNGSAFEDESGNLLSAAALEAGTYTVVFSLATGYDAWADGVTGDIEIEITIFDNMATTESTDFETEITTTYGELSDVLGYIAGLSVATNADFTVTINGVTYSYNGSAFQDENDNKLSDAELAAGTYTVVFALADGYDAWAGRLRTPTVPTTPARTRPL